MGAEVRVAEGLAGVGEVVGDCRCQVLGVKYQVSGVRCQVLVIRQCLFFNS